MANISFISRAASTAGKKQWCLKWLLKFAWIVKTVHSSLKKKKTVEFKWKHSIPIRFSESLEATTVNSYSFFPVKLSETKEILSVVSP